MRIIQVCERFPPSIGGLENHVYNLSYELSLRGHQVTVLTSDIKNISFLKIDRADKSYEKITDNFEVYRFKAYPPGIPYASAYGIIPSLIKSLIKSKPDIVHIQSYMLIHSDISSILSRTKKIPYILTVHTFGDAPPRPHLGALMKFYIHTLGKINLKSANKIIVLVPDAAEYISKLGIDKEKICIIPNGINCNHFLNMPSPYEFKKDYKIDGKMVLFVGGLSSRKGVQYLIKAMPKILRKIPDTTLVVVGVDWGFQSHLEGLSHELRVDKKVLFTGSVSNEQLLDAYSACDVFVLPSEREGLPTVILEAMASGKPVIATNVGGNPYVIEDGVTGFLVEYGNETKLADKIIYLLENEDIREKVGKNARKKVGDYSWEKIAEGIEKIYTELV